MRGVLEDLKHALRIYRRTPGASVVAVGVLAIGLAAVAAFVSLYVDLILRPHPGFERGSRIVTFGWSDGNRSGSLQLSLIERIAEESATLEAVAGAAPQTFLIGAERKAAIGELVTREFFSGVRPRLALGRGFLPEEHEIDAEPVAVISYRHWQEAFGGREDVLGQTVQITGSNQSVMVAVSGVAGAAERKPTDFRIVGVMGPSYTGTLGSAQAEAAFWIPVEPGLLLLAGTKEAAESLRTRFSLRGIGQRKRGAGAAAVAKELNARYLEDLSAGTFATGAATRFDVLDGLVANAALQRNTQRQLQLFLGGSILLALVAAANVSLFLLARAPGRRRELAIRMAVGAPLTRLSRQLASEAALLVVAGAALGLVASVWLAEFLRGLTFWRQAQWRDVTLLDWRVLALVGAFLTLLTLLVSLAPMLGLKRLGIAASSRQISARPSVAQRVAGTAQIAIAGTLGGAALAFAWHLGAMLFAYPGYETRNIHVATFAMPPLNLAAQGNVAAAVASATLERERIRDAVAALPGVQKLTMGGGAPGIMGSVMGFGITDPNDPAKRLMLQAIPVDEHYVDVLGLTLLHGRSFGPGEPTAVLVNRALARLLFGRDDVVGESMPFSLVSGQRSEIVGVLDDLSYQHPLADVTPMAFIQSTSAFVSSNLAFIESTLSSAALRQALQRIVDSGAVEAMTISDVTPLAARRSTMLAPDRARSFLTIGAAALVVLLAAFGFYGTQRYLVAAGRREYAIRASLGAGPRALGRLVFRRGFVLGLPGLVFGLPFAFIVVARLRDDYISRDVSPALVSLGVALGVVLLLGVASIGPARRARATQPAPLLRGD